MVRLRQAKAMRGEDMEGLSDRQKLILWIEAGQKTLEMACRAIEEGKAQQAIGFIHSEMARAEDKRLKLLMEDAQDKEEERERAELEHLWG
jgi:cell division inhibitor SulA